MKNALGGFLHTIATIVAAFGMLLSGQTQSPQAPQSNVSPQPSQEVVDNSQVATLGASNPIPDTIALFTTSLASPISASATSMTLVSASYNGGANTLASSTYGFIIDEGTSVEEVVTADCTGTTCTNMTRGIDNLSGATAVSSLQFAHRRGASVKITTAPSVLIHNQLLQGIQTFPNPLKYSSSVSTSTLALNRQDFASWGLVQDTAFNAAGIINASASSKGVVQLATGLQLASSTGTCSSTAPCVLSADNATSTFNTATAPLKVVVTQNSGKIDQNFLPTTITGPFTINTGTSTFASTTVNSQDVTMIGKNRQVFSTAGATTTWTVPSGVYNVHMRLYGAGGGGGGGNTGVSGNGGGAGGYCDKMASVTPGQAITVFIASGGTAGNSNSSGSAAIASEIGTSTAASLFCQSFGGGGGGGPGSGPAGAGGTASGGDFNVTGQAGAFGNTESQTGVGLGAPGGTNGFTRGGGGGMGTNAGAAGDNALGIIEY